MKRINLLFAVHNHQPAGNLEKVFRTAWESCYEPFLAIVEKYPQFRLSLHYSGSLLEWLEEKRPDFLGRLKALIARGQVEVLGGGFYEPFLPFIPERDAVGQMRLLTQYLGEKLNARPQGFWLPERVWMPTLPKTIAPSGLKYTIVDDAHFRYAGFSDEDMFGHYVTEYEGFPLCIFPIHKQLRYAIPFRPPEETIEALRFWATDSGNLAATYADDGEKFGLWPGTYGWVYEEKWLEKFIRKIDENQDWIRMLTFGEYMERFSPQGRAYLPPASYDEMMAWALPAMAAIGHEEMVRQLKQEGRFERYKPFLRGGSWENSLVKYPEGNHLHKKMLYVSEKVHRTLRSHPAAPGEKDLAAPAPLQALWKGQAGDAYWHGLFGGIYFNFLRHALYQNLIAAERLAEREHWGSEKYLVHEIYDLDKDLYPEVLVTSPELGVILKPNYGGSLVEMDYRPKDFNLTNVLTRRPEAYHRKLRRSPAAPSSPAERPKAIYDSPPDPEEGLVQTLMYDWYTRYSFLDHFLGKETTFEQFQRCQYPELGDFVNQPYDLVEAKELEHSKELAILLHRSGGLFKREGRVPVEIFKRFLFHRDRAGMEVEYEIVNRSTAESKLWFGVEINLSLLAGDDWQRYFIFPGLEVKDRRMVSGGVLPGVEAVRLRDESLGFEVSIDVSPAGQLWRFPLETISRSERGPEKTYQGTVLLFHWPFSLKPGEKKRFPFSLSCGGI